MKFPRTIRLDGSDPQVFDRAAEPGQPAVSGAFAFSNLDPDDITGKTRQAFANGFLGVTSYGWSTLVAMAEITEEEYDDVVLSLARHFVERYGALDIAAALPAERDEAAFAADPDARENYEVLLRFRDHLLRHETLEGCYLVLIRDGDVDIPPLFIDQLVHAILRGVLDGCDDPLRARSGELFFRTQKVSVQDGALLFADEEIVEQYAQAGGMSPIAQLLASTPMSSVELDVLDRNNAKIYWARSDQFDTVLDLTFARPGLDGLCRVLEAWVVHFLGVEVGIQPVQAISDEKWAWHLGLDSDSSAILNDLYDDRGVGDDRLGRLLSLFRLEFKDASAVLDRVAGRPVYMGLAMNPDNVLRMKPQNILLNLPLARPV